MPFSCDSQFEQILYKSLILIMYYGCLRVGEAVIADGSADHTMRFQAIKPIYVYSRLDPYLSWNAFIQAFKQ